MKLKEEKRTATVAWSPSSRNPSLLAAGTMAGAIDENFMSTAELEILSLDLSSREENMTALGVVSAPDRFHRLAWGTKGIEDGSLPYGLLAGGLADGSINVWNPQSIISHDADNALVAQIDRHSGPVRGLEFNSFAPNLLASGASDAEIYIIDLTTPHEPTVFSPGTKSATDVAEIACVSWNPRVQHILGSTSYGGTSVIWDLKQKRPVIAFGEQNQKRQNTVLAWNPDVATQIIVASGDDRYPVLQVWDLRNAYSPVMELQGHTKGILSMSWCPNDAQLLLSSGKDNRTIVWNPIAGEMISELPATANWTFDVQWSPKIPAIVSRGSFDGTLQVMSLQDVSYEGGLVEPSAQRRAPKWLQRPVGASFAFGGKLLSFFASPQPNVHAIQISSVVTDKEMVIRSKRLEETIQSNNLLAFCTQRKNEALTDEERDEWTVMSILFEKDARRHLLKHLGFSPDELGQEIAEFQKASDKSTKPADDFFDELGEEPVRTVTHKVETMTVSVDPESAQQIVQKALMVGNFEAAVNCCMMSGQMADALLLAACGGAELWAKTRDLYFQRERRPFIRFLAAIVKNELREFVGTSDLTSWKKTMAILCTYAKSEDFPTLCDILAHRLADERGDKGAATFCYMCASNVDKVLEIWTLRSKGETSALMSTIEKVEVFRHAAQHVALTPSLVNLYGQYAEMLAAQGHLSLASHYLSVIGQDPNYRSFGGVLKDRIFHSQLQSDGVAPPFPFERYQVGQTAAIPKQPPQAAAPLHQAYVTPPYALQGAVPTHTSPAFVSQPQQLQPQPQPQPQPPQAMPTHTPYSQPQQQTVAFPQQVATSTFPPYSQPMQPMQYAQQPMQPPVQQPPVQPPMQQQPISQQGVPTQRSPQPTSPQPPYQMPAVQAPQQPMAQQPIQQRVPTQTPPTQQMQQAQPPPAVAVGEAREIMDRLWAVVARVASVTDKRKTDDVKKRLTQLDDALAGRGDPLSAGGTEKLQHLSQALYQGDTAQAHTIHSDLIKTDWTGHSFWLTGIKRIIDYAQNVTTALDGAQPPK